MRIPCLYLTSISCGFCMMALEILGARTLFPFYGSGIDVWAAIISVFILSLSVGYWAGGRLADRARSNAPLAWIIISAAVIFLLLPAYGRPLIEGLGSELHQVRGGVLLGALLLFFPPSLLLGSVSPMLVKLVFTGAERVGRSTGTLYAVGSVGNVMGVLVTDFVLLDSGLDMNQNILLLGTCLAVTGIAHAAIRLPAEAAVAVPVIAPGAPA